MTAARYELATGTAAPPGDGGAVPVVRVLGEVDITNAGRLRHDLAELAAGGLIVDLSGVGYFDSAGFAVLDTLLAEHPIAVVVAPAAVVRTAMTLMHLPFHDSTGAALAALRPG